MRKSIDKIYHEIEMLYDNIETEEDCIKAYNIMHGYMRDKEVRDALDDTAAVRDLVSLYYSIYGEDIG